MNGASGVELDLSVVLPAHNEITLLGSTVTNLVAACSRRGLAFELIVVENGSSDGTLRLARLLAAQIAEVRVLAQGRANYGAAIDAGIRAAAGRLVAVFDVDYYDLSFLDEAIELVDAKGAAIVVASKRAPGARDRRPIARRALTFGFTTILRRVLGLEVSDAHGMKVLDRLKVADVVDQTVLRNSVFDVELVLRAQRAGLSVAELPALVVERRPTRSAVTTRALTSLLDVAKLRVLLGAPASHDAIGGSRRSAALDQIRQRARRLGAKRRGRAG